MGNSHLKCDASLFPPNCNLNISLTVTLRTKPVKTLLQKFMIVQYIILGYTDLFTDILAIIALFALNNILVANINIFFIVLGMLLGIYNSPRKPMDIFLNLTQLSILVDGIETLRTGRQTEGLVVGKKQMLLLVQCLRQFFNYIHCWIIWKVILVVLMGTMCWLLPSQLPYLAHLL